MHWISIRTRSALDTDLNIKDGASTIVLALVKFKPASLTSKDYIIVHGPTDTLKSLSPF